MLVGPYTVNDGVLLHQSHGRPKNLLCWTGSGAVASPRALELVRAATPDPKAGGHRIGANGFLRSRAREAFGSRDEFAIVRVSTSWPPVIDLRVNGTMSMSLHDMISLIIPISTTCMRVR